MIIGSAASVSVVGGITCDVATSLVRFPSGAVLVPRNCYLEGRFVFHQDVLQGDSWRGLLIVRCWCEGGFTVSGLRDGYDTGLFVFCFRDGDDACIVILLVWEHVAISRAETTLQDVTIKDVVLQYVVDEAIVSYHHD